MINEIRIPSLAGRKCEIQENLLEFQMLKNLVIRE